MKLQNFFWFILTNLLLSLLIHSSLFSQHIEYRVVPIPSQLVGYGRLNDSDVVVGRTLSQTSWMWNKGIITNLPGINSGNRWATDINNNRVVVGAVSDSRGWTHACEWQNGMLGIIDAPDYLVSWASSINSVGTVVGRAADTASAWEEYPFIFTGSVTILDNLENYQFNSINNGGIIAGTSWSSRNHESGRAFMYYGGTVTFLSAPGSHAEAFAINNSNHVLCEFDHVDFYLWKNGTQVFIESFTNFGGLNDYDAVVGHSSSLGAIIWENGEVGQLDTLIDPNLGIHLASAFDINNKGRILCNGSDNMAYLLIPVPTITKPVKDDMWIAGEKDNIKWDFVGHGENLLIEFSSDSGQTYQAIAADVSADSEKYVWDIPKDILSTKCLIRLRDNSTLDTLAVSEMFKIKPYIITKIDATTGDFIPYDISKDRWGFGNYQNDMWPYSYWFNNFDYNGIDPFTNKTYRGGVFTGAFRFDFPDWISWVNTFGVSSCYWSISLGIYSPTAVVTWGINKRVWGGSCAGIANSNALVFNNMDNFRNKYPDFPNFNNPIDVTSNSSVIKTITELFTHQYGNQIEKHIADNWNSKTPNQTLNELKEVLKKGNTDIRTISFWHNTKSMGHCILPYAIEQDDVSKNIWYIYVYDNSYPNNQTALILIDTSANGGNGSWLTQYAWQDWGGNGKLILDLPATTYLESAEFKNRFNSGSTFLLGDTELQVYPTQYSDVEILDSQGNKTGYSGGNVNSEIPGSVPLIIPTSTLSPPYCYSLSVGNYSIKLNNFSEDTIACNLMKGNRLFSYQRYDAGNNQIDKLYFDGGLSLSNSDQTIKQINLKSILADTTNEKIFSIRSLDLSENDSARIEAVDGNKLKLTSYASSSKEYEIGLEYASETVSQLFSNSLVQLSGNSTHTIVPDWSNIYENQLEILIDLGNDGTIDDTLYLDNEVTGIGNDQGSLIPTEYRLEQNYPNPFNNTTVIKYSIPIEGLVTLKIYSIIGEEVAILVNETKQAGNYDVTFNSDNLPSGVYFYRLQAGDYVQTRKMILLK